MSARNVFCGSEADFNPYRSSRLNHYDVSAEPKRGFGDLALTDHAAFDFRVGMT